MKFGAIGRLLFLSFTASSCFAQSPGAGDVTPAPAKPAAAPARAPDTAPTEKKKPKKVWTNDEIGSVGGAVSVVGEASAPASDGAIKKPTTASEQMRQRQIETYRDEVQQLRAQTDSIDKRIAQLKSFKAENTSPSGGININEGYNMVPLEDQVKQLEDKKKKLAARIDDIEVEARKNGIDSGELR